MKTMYRLILFALLSITLAAQPSPTQITYWYSSPSGLACGSTQIALYVTTGTLYTCQSGVYTSAGGNGAAVATPYITYSGTSYYMLGQGPFAATLPSATTFTWDNQGTATVASVNGEATMSYPAGRGNNSIALRYASAPGANFTVTVVISPNLQNGAGLGANNAGVCMRESATGKIMSWMLVGPGSSVSGPLNALAWTNSTTPNGAALNAASNIGQLSTAQYMWSFIPLVLRLSYNGTSVTAQFSYDGGTSFITMQTVTATTVFTTAPDQGCWGAFGNTAARPLLASFNMTTP